MKAYLLKERKLSGSSLFSGYKKTLGNQGFFLKACNTVKTVVLYSHAFQGI